MKVKIPTVTSSALPLVAACVALLAAAGCGDSQPISLDPVDDTTGPDVTDPDSDGEPDTVSPPDVVVFDLSEPDVGEDTPTTGPSCDDAVKPFFCPCETNTQCASNYCIPVDDDVVARRCTRDCIDDCPNGWECRGMSGGGDPIFVCQPPIQTLCRPCETDSNCERLGARCVDYPDTRNCGQQCNPDRNDCPEGYACQGIENELGQVTSYQCLRESGSCNCPDGTDYTSDPLNCSRCGFVCEYFQGVAGCADSTCFLAECQPDWVDLDGIANNGCEYRCTFTSSDDWPDASCDANNSCDQNCDGIDGDWNRATFVAPTGSAQGAGTPQNPVNSITLGIARAKAQGKDHVYVAAGTYSETVTLEAGVSIFGGYSNDGRWQRNLGNFKSTITTSAGAASVRVVIADGISTRTVVDGFEIIAGTNANPGGSSYGIWVRNSTRALEFIRVTSVGGNGGPGAGGAVGNTGGGGNEGQPGVSSSQSSGGLSGSCTDCNCNNETRYGGPGGAGATNACTGTPDTAGGKGGSSGCGNGGGGSRGDTSAGGAPGGAASSGQQVGNPGSPGSNGAAGTDGGGGTSAGSVSGTGFWTGNAGSAGAVGRNGVGGGGGGGGGGHNNGFGTCASWGGGGGGGGGGGCGGTPGQPGTAGGGSFGIFLFNASPTLTDSGFGHRNGGNGGNGGRGGDGGPGRDGRDGGVGCQNAANGGKGGKGGNGGRGGHGGGGAGGIAYGLYAAGNSNPGCSGLNFSPPNSGGTGGTGGRGPGNAGANGDFGDRNLQNSACP